MSMDNNYESEFFFGEPLQLESGLVIYQPTIKEIKESVGLEYYEFMLMSLSRYSYEYKFDFEDMGLDYKNYSTYDMFIDLICKPIIHESISKDGQIDYTTLNNKQQKVEKCLKLIFGNDFMLTLNNGDFILGYTSEDNGELCIDVVYDNTTADEVRDAIYQILLLKKPKERKPANEMAKKFIKMDIEWQRKHRVGSYSIYTILTSLFWKSNYSGTHEELYNLTIHQVYEGYLTIQKINNHDNILSGIWHGTVNQAKINMDKMNWINKI